uniref:peptide-methionine (S)-S-oxide reductase n=1 Tax=Grammatophora oceanica TaxID=210454 RepID=A0A7S1Y5I1_9STRA|mmetsp:Transcript_27979/g.41197  ORF Transcript_27979/g.41197 Transcript_27979/m.41197 type:complete len:108 (+) Transcript_27979:388-711(+)|eukprot:CAMPEP_0194049186 /NCGR_PEP_ID=MMETSP0009_2-20130614/29958_1 /TAXON_ID=210454 /ORGANISM="Grammatophora oceanica, Strain CCMP 410" /LENGTH=107 /DNA_ID=CAMNT_0038695277 /DNA_START=386 /DNA_END=709 /DNA_ORIENTATION=+
METASDPTYKNVQDYAESIRVTWDPQVLNYGEVLKMFFSFHTPMDPRFSGTQYRSAIFYNSEEQKKEAEAAMEDWGSMARFVALEPTSEFYRGEEYHQKYMLKFGAA